ncbi:MAG: response regulator transcription factor [Actinomycetota bacterium]
MTKALIMIVDDEVGVRDLLSDAMSLSGFETLEAKDGMTALTLMRQHKPDLLIIDINMPIMDGFDLLERMRANNNDTPVIMLTAREDRADVSRGLRLGADDYVTKPFGLEELTLRVQAILKRSKPLNPEFLLLTCGPISLNEETYQAFFNEKQVDLSKTEFRLLQHLLLNKGRVLTKTHLLSEVWGIDFASNSSVVDTYISYLRRKLHIDGFDGIKTVRGVGFQILEPKAPK